MLKISEQVTIPSNEIELRAIRSQGAGGQNVNKVATAIHLRFDVHLKEIIISVLVRKKKRMPTKPSKGAKRRRLDSKAQRSQLKTSRRKVDYD